jgi:ABC-type dipeptide/oligopeptide/nickel transport system permease component
MIAVLGQSLPSFWLALICIEIFSVRMGILPVAGWETPANYVLPVGVTSVFVLATITRLLRTSMLEVLDSEYVKMARAKGVPENAVIVKHVMRNALIPVVTFGLMYISIVIGNMIIVEIVFAWPGFGLMMYHSLLFRDYPVIQSGVLIAGIMVVSANLLADLLYAVIDPRIRYN